ncbi:MAG: glycosyltransferase family 39 protein [Clostridia bacterium]
MENVILTISSIIVPLLVLVRPLVACKKDGIKALFENYRYELGLTAILICGFLLRSVMLGTYPGGLNQDEASIGYEAFSILNSGVDRNGVPFPVHLISWGSGQNAFYAYLCIPFIKLFGLTTFAIRLPMCVVGCLSIFVFSCILKTLWGKKTALIGTIVFALNPWHIMKSRWALESNIFPDLILIGVWFLVVWLIQGKKFGLYFSAILLGLSAYAYGTAYFFLPVFCVILFAGLLIKKKVKLLDVVIYIAIIFVVSLPIIIFVIINRTDIGSIEIFGITIPKLFYNRQEQLMNFDNGFFKTVWTNIVNGLKLLVVQTDTLPWNSMQFFGTTCVATLPFLVLGIVRSFLKKDICDSVFSAWLVTSLIIMAFVDANINRLNVIWIPMIYFVGKGMLFLIEMFPKIKIAILASVVCLGIAFSGYYFGNEYQNYMSYCFNDGYLNAIEYVENKKCEDIVVTNGMESPYITVLFQTQMSSEQYLESREIWNEHGAFEQVSKLGKYSFEEIDMNNLRKNKCYIVSYYDLTEEMKKDSDYLVTYFNYLAVVEKIK